MSTKPAVFITRRLPEAVEARAGRDYDCRPNETDAVLGAADLVKAAAGVRAVLTCPTERWSRKVIEALPGEIEIIATFSVGYDTDPR